MRRLLLFLGYAFIGALFLSVAVASMLTLGA